MTVADEDELIVSFNAALEEFNTELRIDKHSLDEEISKQGDLYFRAAQRAAEASSRRDRAKHDLALEEADCAQSHRLHKTEEGGRATDASVKETVLLDKRVKRAHRLLIAWAKVAQEWQAMQAALDQRSRMLRDLTQLYVSGYFTVSSTGVAGSNYRDARADIGRQRLHEQRQTRAEERQRLNK